MSSLSSKPIAWALAALTTACILCAAAGAAPADRGFVDDRGRAVRIDQPPSRIISLLPSLTETVCALGGCSRLVATDRYSNWPQSVASLPKLGGIEDAGVERLIALRPDLVLASLSSRLNDRLEELGIPVVAIHSNPLEDVHRMLNLVARILGTPQAGEMVWRRTEARIAAAAARMPAEWRGRRAYIEVSDAPHAASASSYLGELLAQLGLANAVPGELGAYPELNPEFVVRAQPDLILAASGDLAAMPARPGWGRMTALASGRGCGFSPGDFDLLVRPGPRLGEAADKIVECLSHLPALKVRS
jgi:iron complex transport system substrate-binding protein